MLFFVFYFISLVFFELFALNDTTLYILYIFYIVMFAFNYSNANVISNINFKYSFKLFFTKLFSAFYIFGSILFTNFLFFRRTPQLKWKPLFKRSSYFGLYRSTKNQYLNK